MPVQSMNGISFFCMFIRGMEPGRTAGKPKFFNSFTERHFYGHAHKID
jgi:hypothetical protein